MISLSSSVGIEAWLGGLLIAALGLGTGALIQGWATRRRHRQATAELLSLLSERQTEIASLQRELGRVEAEKASLAARLAEERTQLEEVERRSAERFELLANRLLESGAKKLEMTSAETLDRVLVPLKTKISEFERRVQEAYEKEARERFALKSELEKMILANQQISADAQNLALALKGDVKMQGNWGEIQLERILEKSGLREGEEFVRQGQDMDLTDEDGRILRPDIIVNLPDDKHVILDAKVSLVSYERFVNAEDPESAERHLKDFLKSLRAHVAGLSKKHYQNAEGLRTPDFVLLFCPIESAFSLAMQKDRDIFSDAWSQRIIIVSPTNLLATLRTVASIWKTERQNRNALEIARRAGALYDKFVNFVGDMEKIGKGLDGTRREYDAAMHKLVHGRGNLITTAEKLRELGAKTAKRIGASYLPDETELT